MIFGELFLLIVLIIIVWQATAYLLYRRTVKKLKSRGYRNPAEYVSYSHWMIISYLFYAVIGIIGIILYYAITHWNIPVL